MVLGMGVSRRRLLSRTGAAALVGLYPASSIAQLALGGASLTTISDGYLSLPGSFIFEPMPEDELPAVLGDLGVSAETLTPDCNLAIYQADGRSVLFDVGSGQDFMPTAGTALDGLDQLGVTPEEITDVIFTHAHPDHIWGLIDDFDELVFPNASYRMGRNEWEYWWNPETVNQIGDARAAFAVGARRRMELIEDRILLFNDGEEILPGIAALETPGHTPGHMAFEIRQDRRAVLVVGDAIGNHHVAFAKPFWESGSDQDQPLAVKTRQWLFERLTAEDLYLVGFHLPSGGIGRADRQGDGFRFVPGIL